MGRRKFMTLVGGVAVWPLAARAEKRATQHRIAIFHPAIPTALIIETGGGSAWRAFFAELRRLGYIEGENLIIERYSAEKHHERYTDLARERAHLWWVVVTGRSSRGSSSNWATTIFSASRAGLESPGVPLTLHVPEHTWHWSREYSGCLCGAVRYSS